MAKFYGNIGYAIKTEKKPGVWIDTIIERPYYGDVTRNNRKLQTTDQVNDDITIANEISVISDPFANENFYNIKYVKFMGSRWKVTNVEVQYPRLVLDFGGVYNGPTP